ncbi:MAG: hypothetical protein HQ517_16250 [SAR324 cluster bacterium]|nr:hypothetical protein [SAR324 cluster bacterium]
MKTKIWWYLRKVNLPYSHYWFALKIKHKQINLPVICPLNNHHSAFISVAETAKSLIYGYIVFPTKAGILLF